MHRKYNGKRMGLLSAGILLIPAMLLGGCGGANGGLITGNVANNGGNGGNGASGAFTVTFGPTNTSNANVSAFTPAASTGVFSVVGNLRTLLAGFTGVAGLVPRTFDVSIHKPSPFAVNDTFTVDAAGDTTATVGYVENSGAAAKGWAGSSGTVRITAISGRTVTFALTNVLMQPSDGAGNTATGQFTIQTATGSVTAQQDLS